MSGKARQATLGGFVKGSKQKEAVPASDSGAPELDLSNGHYQSLSLCDPGCLEQPKLYTI